MRMIRGRPSYCFLGGGSMATKSYHGEQRIKRLWRKVGYSKPVSRQYLRNSSSGIVFTCIDYGGIMVLFAPETCAGKIPAWVRVRVDLSNRGRYKYLGRWEGEAHWVRKPGKRGVKTKLTENRRRQRVRKRDYEIKSFLSGCRNWKSIGSVWSGGIDAEGHVVYSAPKRSRLTQTLRRKIPIGFGVQRRTINGREYYIVRQIRNKARRHARWIRLWVPPAGSDCRFVALSDWFPL